MYTVYYSTYRYYSTGSASPPSTEHAARPPRPRADYRTIETKARSLQPGSGLWHVVAGVRRLYSYSYVRHQLLVEFLP